MINNCRLLLTLNADNGVLNCVYINQCLLLSCNNKMSSCQWMYYKLFISCFAVFDDVP